MSRHEPTISVLGTSALLFEAPGHAMTLPDQQRIWALAREAGRWPEVREAVPGMNNLMLSFVRAPRTLADMRARLLAAWDAAQPLPLEGRVIELPVVYGGEGGPHLADVVAHTGLSVDEIVELHSAPLYPVYALGSHPGYCYLGRHGPAHRHAAAQGAGAEHPGRRGIDRRRADRRVGLRRAERLEHDREHDDALLRSGAGPAGTAAAGRQHPLSRREGDPMIEILSASALATVQDLGRTGALRWGVGTSGAMDPLALAAGNLLLGNDEGAAAIEVPVFPFEVRFTEDCAFALTGADCAARLDDVPLLPWWTGEARAGPGADPGPAARRRLARQPRLPVPARRRRRARGAGFAQHAAARRLRRP